MAKSGGTAAFSIQNHKQKKLIKYWIWYSKDEYLLLQIKKADTIMI